jgi:acyl-CoA reductase-like NAD-dependent aldehyde dehydrogenase
MYAQMFLGSSLVKKETYKERRSPFTNDIVSYFPVCNADDVQKALKVAKIAKKMAKTSKISQRCSWLLDVAKQLEANKEDMAKTITDEVGKPIAFARIEVHRCIETITLSSDTMRTMNGESINTDAMPSGKKTLSMFIREPAGVVACITPFNFPLNLVAHKIAPALVSGNTVVLKPTPEAPLTAYKLALMFINSPFAIKDALSIIYGDVEVGSAIVQSDIPRVISFTGSVPVGKIITQNAGIKKVSLELGGNAATFIEKTGDLAYAAKRCAVGAFVNSGQVCISLQRIYVQEAIYDKFSNIFTEETKKLILGNPYDDQTFMGPLINKEAVDRAYNWVKSAIDEGAKPLTDLKSDGLMFSPMVMADVTDDMNIVCQEVFAPIVSLVKVKDFDEAVEKMNNSPYGLQFSIFTNDLTLSRRAIDEFDCGGVVINDIPTLRFDIQPYGGVKLSGVGREGPRFAIEEFSEIKSIIFA